MPLATALVTGNAPHPQLAEEAVTHALEKAGLSQATAVLLFLTPEFSRNAQAAVTAAARRAQCMQVVGAIAAGVLTETGWALDRPAAAAMVLGSDTPIAQTESDHPPFLCYSGGAFPPEWTNGAPRFGGLFSSAFAGSSTNRESAVWQHGRLSPSQRFSLSLPGTRIAIGISTGLRPLGDAQRIDRCNGFDLATLGGQSAVRSLTRNLPEAYRRNLGLHLHRLAALVSDAESDRDPAGLSPDHAIPLIDANNDQSITLAERVREGQHLAWAIRQPLSAEADMRNSLTTLTLVQPAAALMFSCIGRGPFFYGGEDHDLDILRERFPGLPILGVYGTGQIAPRPDRQGNYELQNSVVTALLEHQPTEAIVMPFAETPRI